MLSQLSVGAMRRTTALMRPLTVGQSTAVRRVSTAVPRAGKPSLGTPVTPAAKPRAAKTARSSGGSNTTKAALAVAGGTVLGLGGYWGYFLYSTQQHPVEWAKSVVKNAWSAYQDVADPSEEFIRNSIQPIHMMQAQGFVGTVIVDLEDTVLNRQWDRRYGYRYSKRPHVDEFLTSLSRAGFEVIFYSDNPQAFAMETLNKLIESYPPGTVTCSGLLAREHMFFRDGSFVKRLEYLPRDMNKVVLVDADPATYKWNPSNTLLVKPCKKFDPADDTLKKAAKMIMAMHNSRQSYQSFMSEFAKPTEDEDGNLVPSEDALEKFAARERAKAVAHAEKKRSGMSGLIRNLKGNSANLRRSKVISPHAMSVDQIMNAKRTDGSDEREAAARYPGLVDAPKKPKSFFQRKMEKMHERQREFEQRQRMMAAAQQEGQKKQ